MIRTIIVTVVKIFVKFGTVVIIICNITISNSSNVVNVIVIIIAIIVTTISFITTKIVILTISIAIIVIISHHSPYLSPTLQIASISHKLL